MGDQTKFLAWSLGLASAAMVALGYPGEIQDDPSGRWFWWACAMVPFCYVLGQLLVGLNAATATQPEAARGLIGQARLLTAVSWLTYPAVYIVKMQGINGATAMAAEQVGYSILMWSPRLCSACSSGLLPLPRAMPWRRIPSCHDFCVPAVSGASRAVSAYFFFTFHCSLIVCRFSFVFLQSHVQNNISV